MAAVPPAPFTIRVQLFARYAELLGADHLDVVTDGPLTVGEILSRVRAFPGGGTIGVGTLVAVNLRQAPLSAPVTRGDEVAILPPLAGG